MRRKSKKSFSLYPFVRRKEGKKVLVPHQDSKSQPLAYQAHAYSTAPQWLTITYFLWVYAIEENSLAVSSKRVNRFEGKLNICWSKQELVRTCSVYVNHNRSKISRGSVDLALCYSRDYFASFLIIAQTNKILTFEEEKLFIYSVVNSVIFISFLYRSLACRERSSRLRPLRHHRFHGMVHKYSLCWSSDVVSTVISKSSRTALTCTLRRDCSAAKAVKF